MRRPGFLGVIRRMSYYVQQEQMKEELRAYVRKVVREVGIRCGDFPTYNLQERDWKNEGVVLPSKLDANK